MRKGENINEKISASILLFNSHNNLAKEVLLLFIYNRDIIIIHTITDEKTEAQIYEMGSSNVHSLKVMRPVVEYCSIYWSGFWQERVGTFELSNWRRI